MSEVRTNSITDAAGTGAPDFPNGIEVSAGNVGIGTATPTDLVQLVGGNILVGTDSGDPFNSQSRVRIQGAGSEYIQIKGDGTGSLGLLLGDATDNFTAGILSSQPENNLIFHAGNAERVRIAETGNVGIGTTDPQTKLEISSNNTAGTALNILRFNDADTSTVADQATGKIEFYVNDASVGGTGVASFIAGLAAGTSGGGYLNFATSNNGSTGAIERFRIAPNGAFGIGGANYGTSGQVLTSGGAVAPSWESVGTAIAGLAYGAVGTYIYGSLLATNIADNGTYAGSSIVPAGILTPSGTQLTDASGVAAEMNGGGSALSGTWRAMGRSQRVNTTTRARISLFLRIS